MHGCYLWALHGSGTCLPNFNVSSSLDNLNIIMLWKYIKQLHTTFKGK